MSMLRQQTESREQSEQRNPPKPRSVIRNNGDVAKAKWDVANAKLRWHKVKGCTGYYLVCDPPGKRNPEGAKRWMFRYKNPSTGKWNELGDGHVSKGVTLEQAKAAWMDHQFHLREGRDPAKVRQISHGQRVTFAECAEMFIEVRGKGKSESWHHNAKLMLFKHGARLAKEAVGTIDSTLIEQAYAPLLKAGLWPSARMALTTWNQLFDFAKAKKLRVFLENPADWAIHKHLFPERLVPRSGHPGLPYSEMPAFTQELRQHQPHITEAIALELFILTLVRPNKEFLLMEWDEIDWIQKIWTIPAERMKMRIAHRVPLVDRAMELIQLRRYSSSVQYVFAGRSQAALDDHRMLSFLRNVMNIPKEKADIHGFRKTFRTWAKKMRYDRDVCEMILSHTDAKTPVEGAYLDTDEDLLDERRVIMDAWAKYIG
jgi:integrase